MFQPIVIHIDYHEITAYYCLAVVPLPVGSLVTSCIAIIGVNGQVALVDESTKMVAR